MNKSKFVIFVIIALAILISIIGAIYMIKEKPKNVSSVEGFNSNKETTQNKIALSGEEFKSKMKAYNYIVFGPKGSENEIWYTAYNDEVGTIEVEFFEQKDEKTAKEAFNFVKSSYTRGGSKFDINESFKFATTNTDNKYFAISKVDNTILMIKTNPENKTTVTEIFNYLGY